MKSVIILALLCCSYAAEQHDDATKLPQEVKQIIDQHIKNVKQELPIVQQQIKEGKLKVEGEKPVVKPQELPEHDKQFIKDHINKILQQVKDAKKQQNELRASAVTPTLVTLPPFVTDKIHKLTQHVKDVMQQAEIHIPQVINHQIANKKKLTGQQKPLENKVEVIVEIPETITDVVQQVPQVINDQKKDVQEKPVIPANIQGIVTQAQQHIPQVINAHLNSKKTTRSIKEDVKVPEQLKEVVSQVQQHVPQVIQQHVADDQKKHVQEKPVIPANIQGIVSQVHQHIPQVINQHIAEHGHKKAQENPVIPAIIQGIVTQVHQHIPQVINQHIAEHGHKKDAQEKPVTPANIQGIVAQVHQHIPQVINQHIADQNKDGQKKPQVLAQIQQKDVVENSEIPAHVIDIVTQAHQHIPQVINQHITHHKNGQEQPLVAHDIQGIVTQAHQHIPQVINQHVAQHLQEKVVPPIAKQPITEVVNTHVVLNKDAQEPTDIKSIVTQIHKEVPNVGKVDNMITNTDIEPSRVQAIIQQVVPVKVAAEVPQHMKDIVTQVSQHVPQVINHQIDNKKEKQEKSPN